MHDGVEAAEEDEAARTATESTAAELESLVSELGQWRSYFDLIHGLNDWSRSYGQYKQGDGADGAASPVLELQRGELAEGAKQLLGGLTEELLRSGWLAWLADPGMALSEVEEEDGVVVSSTGIELTLTAAATASAAVEREGEEATFPHLKVGQTISDGADAVSRADRGDELPHTRQLRRRPRYNVPYLSV